MADTFFEDRKTPIVADWLNDVNYAVYHKLTETISVKDFGAVGDGVTDDAEAFEKADAAIEQGGTLQLERGKTYSIGRTINIQNAGKLDLNGSTIKATSALVAQLVSYQDFIASYEAPTNFAAFAVTARTVKFSVPSGVSLAAGQVVKLMSNTERITGYKHGMLASVVEVSAGVATINTPFYDGFQVDKISVYRGYTQMEVCNGTFDLTAIGSAPAFTEALLIRGSNAHVHDCVFLGSEYAGIGVRVDCDGAVIKNCKAYGFRNTQGLSDGGRIGYGFAAYGNNTTIKGCHAYACKHGLAAAARDIVSVNVTYQDCQVYEDTSAPVSHYTGSIDLHYNVTGAVLIENCRVVGQKRLLSLRTGAVVRGGSYIQTLGGGQILETFEGPYEALTFEGVRYRLADSASTFVSISSASNAAVTGMVRVKFKGCESINDLGRLIEISRAADVDDVLVEGCTHKGGALLRTIGGNINRLTVKDNDVTTTETAVRVFMDGATYDAANVTIKGNTFRRNVASSDNIIYMDSNSATLIDAPNLCISGNTFIHTGDTGTGYAVNLIQIAPTFFEFSDNRVNRGQFRCISFNGLNINFGVMKGQIIDGTWFVSNSIAPTVITDVSLIGNSGSTLAVSVADFGITKTRYVEGLNNFTSYTP